MLTAKVEQTMLGMWRIVWYLDNEYMHTTRGLRSLVSCYNMIDDIRDKKDQEVQVLLQETYYYEDDHLSGQG